MRYRAQVHDEQERKKTRGRRGETCDCRVERSAPTAPRDVGPSMNVYTVERYE